MEPTLFPRDEYDNEREILLSAAYRELRKQGWLHRDDPIPGLKVVEHCPNSPSNWHGDDCPKCSSTGEMVRSLKVGEALEVLGTMVDSRRKSGFGIIDLVLSTGGMVRREG
jgi:hypothetical protein